MSKFRFLIGAVLLFVTVGCHSCKSEDTSPPTNVNPPVTVKLGVSWFARVDDRIVFDIFPAADDPFEAINALNGHSTKLRFLQPDNQHLVLKVEVVPRDEPDAILFCATAPVRPGQAQALTYYREFFEIVLRLLGADTIGEPDLKMLESSNTPCDEDFVADQLAGPRGGLAERDLVAHLECRLTYLFWKQKVYGRFPGAATERQRLQNSEKLHRTLAQLSKPYSAEGNRWAIARKLAVAQNGINGWPSDLLDWPNLPDAIPLRDTTYDVNLQYNYWIPESIRVRTDVAMARAPRPSQTIPNAIYFANLRRFASLASDDPWASLTRVEINVYLQPRLKIFSGGSGPTTKSSVDSYPAWLVAD